MKEFVKFVGAIALAATIVAWAKAPMTKVVSGTLARTHHIASLYCLAKAEQPTVRVLTAKTWPNQARAGHGVQPPLARSRFQPRLKPSVDMTSDVKSWVKIFYVFIRFSPC